MNVLVSNLNRDVFSSLDVDIIKSITGEFTADEIVQSFSSFFFNRMFLDITAVKDYNNINNIQKLSIGLDMSKVIIFLGDDPIVHSNVYISRLISMGIYNFATNEKELKYLFDNPNQYKDVAHLQTVDESTIQVQEEIINSDTRVIGIKNFTSHAGATSLIYMLKNQLSKNYYVVCLEINKRDFLFYRDKDMISIDESKFKDTLVNYKNANIILVDLNDLDDVMASSLCNEVIYLVDPSVLHINKTFMLNNRAFDKLREFKVVLNRCLFSDKDASRFASEAGVKLFYKLPPLNDRVDNSNVLYPFLEKLGLYQKSEPRTSGDRKFFKF